MPSHPKPVKCMNNKPQSSVLKIKQKNKRRNRQKKKQKTQFPIHDVQRIPNIIRSKPSNYNFDNAIYNATSTTRNQMAVAQMWAKSYETMIKLQFNHRIHYWQNLAINRNTEICELREMLKKQNENNCKHLDKYESYNDEEDDVTVKSTDKEDLESESYLKFLEITLRHREERCTSIVKDEDEDSD